MNGQTLSKYITPFKMYDGLPGMEGRHFYKRPEEEDSYYRPGVTSIIDRYTPEGLKNWLMSSTPAQIKLKQDEGKKKGQDFHQIRQDEHYGHEVQVPAHLQPYQEGYHQMVREYGIVPILSEIPLGSDLMGFGCTIDLFCTLTHKGERKPYIIDYKTNKRDLDSYKWAWQVAAQRQAFKETFGEEVNIGVMWLPPQPWDQWKKPKLIFYNDPVYWLEGFLGVYNAWKQEMYRNLKKAGWAWLDSRPIQIKENV